MRTILLCALTACLLVAADKPVAEKPKALPELTEVQFLRLKDLARDFTDAQRNVNDAQKAVSDAQAAVQKAVTAYISKQEEILKGFGLSNDDYTVDLNAQKIVERPKPAPAKEEPKK